MTVAQTLHEGARRIGYQDVISPADEIIEEARQGRMFILVDDEDRENEGDLVIPAQMATPEAVNFMAKHGRGLICLALQPERIRALGLWLMSPNNQTRHETAFTVSIEAREGVTTGISAHDRARTVAVAIDPTKGPADIVTPGHVFPLIAKEGGVLARAGHTEAAVDLARLAGLHPAGVICEIMNDDGAMARLPDLVAFAQLHGLKIGTIADLIAYRLRYDNLVECAHEEPIRSAYGGPMTMRIYVNKAENTEHVALIAGDVSGPQPVLVRVHAVNMFDDLIGAGEAKEAIVADSLAMIAREGRGVLILIRDIRPKALTEHLKAADRAKGAAPAALRHIGVGSQILSDLGVTRMELLSNNPARPIVGLDAYGLEVTGYRPIERGLGARRLKGDV